MLILFNFAGSLEQAVHKCRSQGSWSFGEDVDIQPTQENWSRGCSRTSLSRTGKTLKERTCMICIGNSMQYSTKKIYMVVVC